jgi:hypothetical protein
MFQHYFSYFDQEKERKLTKQKVKSQKSQTITIPQCRNRYLIINVSDGHWRNTNIFKRTTIQVNIKKGQLMISNHYRENCRLSNRNHINTLVRSGSPEGLQPVPASYKTSAMLLIYQFKSGSDRGKKDSLHLVSFKHFVLFCLQIIVGIRY